MRFAAEIGLWTAVCCDAFGVGQAVSGVAQAAGSVAGATIQAGAIKDAAKLSADATNKATDLLQQRYQTTRGDLAPYNALGYGAGARLAGLYGLPAPTAPNRLIAAPAASPGPVAPTVAPGLASATGALAGDAAAAGQLASIGFQPNASLPPGYSVQQVGGGEGEGPARKVVTDGTGAIIGDLSNVPLADDPASQKIQNNAAVALLASRGIGAPQAPQTPATAPAETAPGTTALDFGPIAQALTAAGQAAVPGALPGDQSAVSPYAVNPIFTPSQGTRYQDFAFNPTVADLENTPGYQFMLAQGLKATQSSAAARGLGLSGAAAKEAGRYATGLADANWKDVYGAELQKWQANAGNFADTFNRDASKFTTNFNAGNTANDQYYKYNIQPLFNLLTGGANAAAQTGQAGTLTGIAGANQLQAGGTNAAALAAAGGNAAASGFKGFAQGLNTINQGVDYNKLFGGGGGGGPNYAGVGLQNYDPYNPNSAINNYIA